MIEEKYKIKVLVFIDWYLPGYKAGGPIRSCSNITDRLKTEIDFSVVTTDTDFLETEPYKDVQSDKWTTDNHGTRVIYLSKKKLAIGKFYKLLKGEKYDIVYINGFLSFYFSILPLLALKLIRSKAKIILAPRGMLGKGSLQIKTFKKFAFIHFSKSMALHKNVIWHASSEREKKDILGIYKNANVVVAPNIPTQKVYEYKRKEKKAGELWLVFLSRICAIKNLDKIFDYLSVVTGNCRINFDVIGPIEDKYYWQLCNNKAQKLPSNVTFKYLGAVKYNELNQVMRKYDFFILPTKHENFGHVVFEAMAAGCPVIISDRTPWNGIEESKAGWTLPLQDQIFSETIKKCVFMSGEEYDEMSANAFKYAIDYMNNQDIIEKNRKLFLEI